MLDIYKTFLFILLTGNITFGQSDIDNAVIYTLELNRTNVRAGEIITLIADLKIMKDFYVYSSHPEQSLSPTYIEWEDSSYFSKVGILQEPTHKTSMILCLKWILDTIPVRFNLSRI